MRAVNLIPADQRRGAGGAAGRSGGGAYFVLGALALIVVMSGAYVLTGKSITDKKAQLAKVTQQATVAEAHAQSLTSYTKFASVRAKREETVQQLAAGRFDWAHALHEVARVLPKNVWLTEMAATTSPSVSLAGSSAGSLRGALAVPAIQISGCTTSQASVARLMARMRLIDGVQRVSLQNSEKSDTVAGASTGAGGGASSSGDCRGASKHFPKFGIVVFYEQAPAPPAATTGSTQTAALTSSTTPSSTTTTPAASGGTTP